MGSHLPDLVFLHSDPAFVSLLRRASEGRYRPRAMRDWSELAAELQRLPPSAVALVDPYHGGANARPAAALFEFLHRFPSATVLAALAPRRGWVEDIRALGEHGIAGVVDLSEDLTPLSLVRLIERTGPPIRHRIRQEIPPRVGGLARAIVERTLDAALAGGGVQQVAAGMRMHRDTLTRWCHRAGLPVPRRLLLWIRLLMAADLLDNPGQTLESVAQACGYSSRQALARALRHQTGLSSSELRERGAFRALAALFHREIPFG